MAEMGDTYNLAMSRVKQAISMRPSTPKRWHYLPAPNRKPALQETPRGPRPSGDQKVAVRKRIPPG